MTYTAVDAVKRAEKMLRILHEALDELETIASDPAIEDEDKVGMMLDCIKEARELALNVPQENQ
jgi:hypothetical protein